ncbi:MAG: TonB-dependent receptor, partial [Amphiplicatus sp.]
GVAAVGSNLVALDQEDMEAVGAVNATQLVNTVPAITTNGSAPQAESSYSYYSPQIHALGASASNTTLVIIDGLRIPGAGTQYAQTDPNILPNPAIQRVEVLADGASSVYGSDAVAGVVNFITRKTYEGAQLNLKAGVGDSYNTRDMSAMVGTVWDTGGVYVAGSYAFQSEIANADRPFLSLGDYTSLGGTNNQEYTCNPATIRTPGSGNNVYLSPDALTTVPNNQSNAPCNNSVYGAAIPSSQRVNMMMRVTQDITDRLNVTGTFIYNHLYNERQSEPGELSGVTVFGAGSSADDLQENPFFQAPAGDPTATQENISWLALREDGNYGKSTQGNDTFYFTAVADYEISDKWTATLSNAYGRSKCSQSNYDTFCQPCALLALNGTGQRNGSMTTTLVPGQNVIALNVPLTPDNSLDIWNPIGASNQTSDAVLRSLYGSDSTNIHYNRFSQTKFEVQGELFNVPAGIVRMAVGAEYLTAHQDVHTTGPSLIGPTNIGSTFRIFNLSRNAYSGYAEFSIPLVSPDMDVPLVYALDVNISGRYDKYNDVGSTSNPKFSANWSPVSWLKLRGNYSTAFVAPPL